MQWTLNDPDVDVERSEVVAERDMAKLRAVVRVAQPSGQVTVLSSDKSVNHHDGERLSIYTRTAADGTLKTRS